METHTGIKELVMFEVFFENGTKRKIGEVKTEKEAFVVINDFLKEHNYKSYYKVITQLNEKEKRIDVGSWSQFFYIVEL